MINGFNFSALVCFIGFIWIFIMHIRAMKRFTKDFEALAVTSKKINLRYMNCADKLLDAQIAQWKIIEEMRAHLKTGTASEWKDRLQDLSDKFLKQSGQKIAEANYELFK